MLNLWLNWDVSFFSFCPLVVLFINLNSAHFNVVLVPFLQVACFRLRLG